MLNILLIDWQRKIKMDGEVMIIFKMRAVIKIELKGDDHLQEELERRSLVLSGRILCSTQSSVGARPANREERQHGLLINLTKS